MNSQIEKLRIASSDTSRIGVVDVVRLHPHPLVLGPWRLFFVGVQRLGRMKSQGYEKPGRSGTGERQVKNQSEKLGR
ncbi:hypothetical protein Pcinc_037240 [Petrolisthes cinctipes]|uniref:Uncharacterized protein n=1 Tax=Petrolisthes cinctipes TaxID=88211 RepID=A0AAE1BSY4_PETCI|nr:hypothetical protein Pcinc_037240 [Petrolisthes cinctipes]